MICAPPPGWSRKARATAFPQRSSCGPDRRTPPPAARLVVPRTLQALGYANQAQPNSAQLSAAMAAAGMEGETGNILAAALGNLTSGQNMGDPNVLAELGRMILAMAQEKQQNQQQLG